MFYVLFVFFRILDREQQARKQREMGRCLHSYLRRDGPMQFHRV